MIKEIDLPTFTMLGIVVGCFACLKTRSREKQSEVVEIVVLEFCISIRLAIKTFLRVIAMNLLFFSMISVALLFETAFDFNLLEKTFAVQVMSSIGLGISAVIIGWSTLIAWKTQRIIHWSFVSAFFISLVAHGLVIKHF